MQEGDQNDWVADEVSHFGIRHKLSKAEHVIHDQQDHDLVAHFDQIWTFERLLEGNQYNWNQSEKDHSHELHCQLSVEVQDHERQDQSSIVEH